ncbi:MAG: monovalent cation/H(+) antiporter subunit G [Pseudomonadota bacterium]
MMDLIGLLVKLAGLAFLLVATIGLLRFEDVFQRMHAATKAGTLGAGLILMGTVINKGTFDAAFTGSISLVFLILTIPVASHILARAAYISGSEIAGIGDQDALRGVLQRSQQPLERSIEELALDTAFESDDTVTSTEDGEAHSIPSLDAVIMPERVRVAALGQDAPLLAKRAAKFAARASLPMTAVVALDTHYADQTPDKAETLRKMRDEVSSWLPDLNKLSGEMNVPIDLVYEEGDAEALMAGVGDEREFLVLPTNGWADHEIGVGTIHATREPDSLLRVVNKHPGPVIYAVDDAEAGPIAVQFDGSFNVWRGLDLAIREGLWDASEVRVYGFVDVDERAEIAARCGEADLPVTFISPQSDPVDDDEIFPQSVMEDVIGVILPDLPRPLRVNWYRWFWQDRIAKDWRGDVLVWTQLSKGR